MDVEIQELTRFLDDVSKEMTLAVLSMEGEVGVTHARYVMQNSSVCLCKLSFSQKQVRRFFSVRERACVRACVRV